MNRRAPALKDIELFQEYLTVAYGTQTYMLRSIR